MLLSRHSRFSTKGNATKNESTSVCKILRRRKYSYERNTAGTGTAIALNSNQSLVLEYSLNGSTEKSPSWEAYIRSAGQEIPRLLWNPKTCRNLRLTYVCKKVFRSTPCDLYVPQSFHTRSGNNISLRVQIIKLIITKFSPDCCNFHPLHSKKLKKKNCTRHSTLWCHQVI